MTDKKEDFTELTIPDQISALAKQIELSFPGVRTAVDIFPSGSAMLDVYLHGKMFLMAYYPKHGFGVDEVTDEDSFLTSYRFTTEDFYAAAEELNRLIKSNYNSA